MHKIEEIVHTRNSYSLALVCFMLNSFTFIPIQNERKESYKEYRECVTHNGRGFRFLEEVFSVLSSKACVGCVCVCGGVGFSLHISPHS